MDDKQAVRIQKLVGATLVLSIFLFPLLAPALVMRANGPEPIIGQIKESLRPSDDLDTRLNELATRRQQERLTVEKWWAGTKLLVMLSFASNATEQQALAIIARLQQSAAVEKVVPVSAYNLHFNRAILPENTGRLLLFRMWRGADLMLSGSGSQNLQSRIR